MSVFSGSSRIRTHVMHIAVRTCYRCSILTPRFCVATYIYHHVRAFPAPPTSMLFLKATKRGLQPAMYIKQCVSTIGLDQSKYGCHSLRRSGAGFLHMIHVPLQDIMSLGDWHSLSVLDYLATPLHRKKDIQKMVCAQLTVE